MARDAVAVCIPDISVITVPLEQGRLLLRMGKVLRCYFMSDKPCFVCWGDRCSTHSFIFG